MWHVFFQVYSEKIAQKDKELTEVVLLFFIVNVKF